MRDSCPSPTPLCATFCHECPGVPKTQVAVSNSTVGACQLTSATSVLPWLVSPSPQGSGISSSITLSTSLSHPGRLDFFSWAIFISGVIVSAIFSANSQSSSSYFGSPISRMFLTISSAIVLLGITLWLPSRNSVFSSVLVIVAAPFAMSRIQLYMKSNWSRSGALT